MEQQSENKLFKQAMTLLCGILIGGATVAVISGTAFSSAEPFSDQWPNGQLRAKGQLLDGLEHGIWTFWREDGTVEAKTEYKSGLPRGKYETYDRNGKLLSKGQSDEDGIAQGWFELYDSDGGINSRTYLVDGRSNGLCEAYSPDGQRTSECRYENDLLHGKYRDFGPDRKVIFEGEFKNGKHSGTWKAYRENGEEVVIRQFD